MDTESGRSRRERARGVFVALGSALLAACSSDASSQVVGTGGLGIAAPASGGSGTGGTPITATGGAGATGGSGSAIPSAGGVVGSGGTGAMDDSHDHCVNGEPADQGDALLPSSAPDEWTSPSGAVDLVLPKPVLTWMGDRVWEKSHDAWHNVRRCRGSALPGATTNAICSHTELIALHQECKDADDGYAFLVMHRHMMQALRRAFPAHAALFQGFPHFPFAATDVPSEWQGRFGTGWSAAILDTARKLDAIEQNLNQFPTEGDLGQYIQCGGMSSGASSIHGALHFKWVVNDSPFSLGKQTVNIDNYMFWKLHGWIDQVWERYRAAKGLAPDEPKLTEALVEQCREMHALSHAVGGTSPDSNMPLPIEHGYFHESVRPILEKYCSGCHSESSPDAGMALGGHIASADVVKGLVGIPSLHGGQYARVVPGNPDQSWLYLKVSGQAPAAKCSGVACNAQVMPPTGQVTATQTELGVIRKWITDGAPAPTP